ncbi:Protein-methionine sulfoxide oxidase mical1 [Oryzias melastigma]|uniref:Protein-methionine sulfoxide oxidase mical1 n=1 Tax=Oryzias melastigma TaxID=30732 RepID=A0A834L0F5_ORYME|nr:Protein-methionine sulfoxide oxidase mical1 [Oryzias melastigma]
MSEEGIDGDDDDDDEILEQDDSHLFDDEFQMPSDPVQARKLERKKMRTLERRARMSELERFRKAQSIQRRLEEIEVTFKDLEHTGVDLEKRLRGEAGKNPFYLELWSVEVKLSKTETRDVRFYISVVFWFQAAPELLSSVLLGRLFKPTA